MNQTPFFTRRAFGRRTVFALCLALMGFDLSATAEDPARHRFLCCDSQGNKVAIIAADGSVEWEFAAQTPQDCWLLPNGNVLFCYRNGAREVSRDKQVVWEYKAPAAAECHSCQPLPNGRVLVAECGLSRLVEAGGDGQGAEENEVSGNPLRLPAGCQRLPNGNTIVCNYLPGGFLGKQPQAFEVTRDKRVVWEFTDHTRFKTVNQIYLLDLPGDAKNSGALR